MKQYWDGYKNKTIRYYFYVQKGLALFNEFRYLLMGVFALYMMMKLDNIILLPIMFFSAIPILLFFGWLSVHHIDKVIEFLNIQYATHFSRYNIKLQEEQLEELRRLNEKRN